MKNLAAKEPDIPSEVCQVQSGAKRKGSIGLKLMSWRIHNSNWMISYVALCQMCNIN